jgi:hypothetical protein
MIHKKNVKIKEDFTAPSISPGTGFQTPDSLPGDNMDTFALAGPGRSKKKGKKKPLIKRVSTFKDFLKGKG